MAKANVTGDIEATPVRTREEIQRTIVAQETLASMSPDELRVSQNLPVEALPILDMITVLAKHSQQLERHQDIQNGLLETHQQLITKIEETINEAT
eukprot:5898111-Karenia_brevis.AAC.1